ncbi:MAG TPA: ABC transporter permease subunit [Candidatus Brocadiia bacterium]|nr:ABC transporter permease subunit [Candidatus Brocadiia bacterium]
MFGSSGRDERKEMTAAGPRIHPLSVISMTFVFVFIAIVVALIAADLSYIGLGDVSAALAAPEIRAAIRLSAVTSLATLLLVALFGAPTGYALSRYRFPGRGIADTIVDMPIVLPPLIIGVSLLVFFQTDPGKWIETHGLKFVYTRKGIVLCQFLCSVSYAIRAAKASFDSDNQKLETLALTLGCTPMQAFRMVALPLARNGIVAGAILAWAHAVGIFGPLMVFAGCVRMKTEVLPTAIYLELSVGRIETALAIALLMLALAACMLAAIHRLAPGKRW